MENQKSSRLQCFLCEQEKMNNTSFFLFSDFQSSSNSSSNNPTMRESLEDLPMDIDKTLESTNFETITAEKESQSAINVLFEDVDSHQFTTKSSCQNSRQFCSSYDYGDVSYDSEEEEVFEDCEDFSDDEDKVHSPVECSSFKRMSHVIMFPEAQLSTRDVSIMVIAYSIRYISTFEGRDSLFEMCKIFAGEKFKDWNTSKFVMSQLYDPPSEVIKLCFICTECCNPLLPPISKKYFKKCHVKCKCGKEYDLTTQSPNYVISIDIKYQLEILLKDEEIKCALLKGIRDVKERDNGSGNIRDVYDGELYKKAQRKYSDASHLVTLNCSTDGAPLCNSANKSFWPTQLIINELPPKLRFKYSLLSGLSISGKEPSPEFMNSYINYLVGQINHLSDVGIDTTDENGISIKLTIVALHFPLDSAARPMAQNRIQYSGYFGCSWCYETGLYCHHAVHYPVNKNDADIRTHESHINDYENKLKSNSTTINGVKGFSVLMNLLTLDMVWGFPNDYLHSILLGVVKYLFDIWIETKILKKDTLTELNNRLLNMTPSHEIHRLPRMIKDKAKWKGTEWRSWLLYYSLVCLKGLISDSLLNHYALLVESIFILLQDSISETELDRCEKNLLLFVVQLQEMFGNSVMTFNIHSLLHLVKSVRMSGPLWTVSTFPFEGAIFYLKREITGPKGVYNQIAKRSLLRLTFSYTYKKLASSETCKNFCENLFAHPDCKNAVRTNDDVLLLGYFGEENNFKLFDRCIFKSSVFHSIKYKRPTKTNDTFVMLNTKEIGEIQAFKYENKKTQVSLNLFIEIPDDVISVSHIKKIQRSNKFVTVPIQFIDQKLVYIQVLDSTFVSKMTSTIEIQ